MSSTLDCLIEQARSMNANDAMKKVGMDPDTPSTLAPLVEVVERHECGATPRAVLIWVRGYLQRVGKHLEEVIGEPETMAAFKKGVPAASSVSRAIPLGLVMRAYDLKENLVVIDLGAGRAHAAQVFLQPEILRDKFFTNQRMAIDPSRMSQVKRVIAVDSRIASWEEAVQVYLGPNGEENDKVRVMRELESREDHEGRLIRVTSDIRELDASHLRQLAGADARIVIMLNNVLYAVQPDVRVGIEAHVNRLASALNANILQMEGCEVFEDSKPNITLPGAAKPLVSPAYVRIGQNLDNMRIAAMLDGSTGKPFILVKPDGSKVFIGKDGEEVPYNEA